MIVLLTRMEEETVHFHGTMMTQRIGITEKIAMKFPSDIIQKIIVLKA